MTGVQTCALPIPLSLDSNILASQKIGLLSKVTTHTKPEPHVLLLNASYWSFFNEILFWELIISAKLFRYIAANESLMTFLDC